MIKEIPTPGVDSFVSSNAIPSMISVLSCRVNKIQQLMGGMDYQS